MATEHRVEGHLGVAADEYDRAIRTFVPGYDEMLATIVRWLDGHVPDGGMVVDLGAGTGALSAAILDALPAVRVTLRDIDPAMLEVAGVRCGEHEGRFSLQLCAFTDPLPACDAVVATLALHHIANLDAKIAVYRAIREALAPGGLLLVGDATVHEDGPEHDRVFAEWSLSLQRHGISAAEAEGHFAQWAGEDRYFPLATELDALRSAGFARPECFWKLGGQSVFGGFRDGGAAETPTAT